MITKLWAILRRHALVHSAFLEHLWLIILVPIAPTVPRRAAYIVCTVCLPKIDMKRPSRSGRVDGPRATSGGFEPTGGGEGPNCHQYGHEGDCKGERDNGDDGEDVAKVAQREKPRKEQWDDSGERGDGGREDGVGSREKGGTRLEEAVGGERVAVGVRNVDEVIDRHTHHEGERERLRDAERDAEEAHAAKQGDDHAGEAVESRVAHEEIAHEETYGEHREERRRHERTEDAIEEGEFQREYAPLRARVVAVHE